MVEGGLLYGIMEWLFLLSIGTYHMFNATRNHLLTQYHHHHQYSAKPYHPLSLSFTNLILTKLIQHLQLYITILCLTVALIHQLVVSSESDPLMKGRSPVHLFTSLQSVTVILFFLLLSLILLLSDTTSLFPNPLPPDLFFALASTAFYLDYYSVSSSATAFLQTGLQSRCDSLSANISALSSFLCLLLACFHCRLFIADLALGASVALQGMWSLQTGLSLHVDAFIPQGCHKLLDVVSGVEGSTKCDLDDSRLRAVAVLDLLFLLHVLIVVVLVLVVYAASSSSSSKTNTVGAGGATNNNRRFGSYEALPTLAAGIPSSSSSSSGNVANLGVGDSSHIQMKALAGTQA